MAHDIEVVSLSLALAMGLITGLVAYALYHRRKHTGIKALSLLIYLFSCLSLLGFLEVIQTLFHHQLFLFPESDTAVPLILSPVRIVNLVAILVLYFFAENILEVKYNLVRFSILVSLISSILVIGLVSLGLGQLITTDLLLPFTVNTRLDEFFFDLLQLYVVSFVAYLFIKQYQFTESSQYRRYIQLLLLASFLYLGSMIIEVFEHFGSGFEVDAFISAFPTILLLAYIYIRYPNLIYLVPTDVRFLQLVGVETGIPVYVAEFEEEEQAMDFLIGPGLSSIRTMLRELLTSGNSQRNYFSLKSFEYSGGYLVFEESSGLFALLQADRLSKVLLTSLTYFIREFEKIFGDQIRPFKGTITKVNGVSPDDLLRRCVPIVQAKPIISSIKTEEKLS